MAGLPKFVRDQMARTPAPSSHPDADILTAFAENALPSNERQQVIEHLSACSDCRDVVFLAQPETTSTQTVLSPKSRRFTWMAWASVAAVVVVVASAVIRQHEQVTKIQAPVTIATTSAPPSQEAQPSASPTARDEGAVSPAIPKPRKEPARETDFYIAKTKPSSEPSPATRETEAKDDLANLKPPSPAPVAPAVPNQEVGFGNIARQQTPTGPDQRNIAGQIQQAQGPSSTANNVNIAAANESVEKAASAPAAKVAKKQRADEFHGIATGYAVAPAAAPITTAQARWQISSTGMLERSFVADNWTPVLAETGSKFHVVSVIGNAVWAGGEHGALYVSRDAGATWNLIAINTTSTITSIYFSDDLHGTLETADKQVWKTADGGSTWDKQ